MNHVLRKVVELQRADEIGELMRESRIRHGKVKLQSGDEIIAGKAQSWGAQAASLQFPAACRKHLRATPKFAAQSCSRLAAGYCRLAACAPPEQFRSLNI